MSVTSLAQHDISGLPAPADSLWRLSVDRYHQMIQHGILTEDDPVELLEGFLVRKESGRLWPLSVERYHEVIRLGILTDDDLVELVEGVLVRKMPKNPPHRLTTRLLREAIEDRLPGGWHVQSQEPITLEDGEPEPDVAVVKGEPEDYATRHPGPADLVQVTEVSAASLTQDRAKKRTYARARIPLYWIVNLVAAKVEVYTQPGMTAQGPDYLKGEDFDLTQTVSLEVGGQVISIPVADFLRPAQ